MKSKENFLGIMYFFAHFIIEITSFYIVSKYIDSKWVWYLALMYDFYAFVPQGVFGYFKDKGLNVNLALIGGLLSTLALTMLYFDLNMFLVVFVIAIGNCLVHIEGAEVTLRSSNGKMTPSAIFVSGGSFGVITGKLLALNNVSVLIVLLINLLIFVPIIICERNKNQQLLAKELDKFNYSNKKLSSKTIIILAVIVVVVRSYMGYGIPTSWNKTIIQGIALFCLMGLGKALGGVSVDKLGIRKTVLISTIGALPFLVFGDSLMIISLIGVMLFSMTMAVTLALIVSEKKNKPGVAFGFTTLGLFLGSLPMFVLRINSLLINCIIVSVLTIISYFILISICRKENN